MSYTALYRKYRPIDFKSVVGQDVIVKVLKNSIKSNHISHAYLFAGPRGTGKTSVAKIFAHAVNCENFTEDICGECTICQNLKNNESDIIEIDAASNNGVEEIRTIRDNVKLLPTFCKYKIYIIDEVHMLSTGAFNALLKTLEEPPSHVIFILATTDPNKIPLTILSRCQRFDFNKIDNESLNNRLKYILKNENGKINENVIDYISKSSDGGLRDAINLLDQILSLNLNDVKAEDIDKLSGKISKTMILQIYEYLVNADYTQLLDLIEKISLDGKSFTDVVNNMLIFIRDLGISKQVKSYFSIEYETFLMKFNFSNLLIVQLAKILNELLTELKKTSDQKLMFEIYVMNMIEVINKKNDEEVTNQQEKAEHKENLINEKTINKLSEPMEDVKSELTDIMETSNNINSLKKIRINNVLAKADKSILNKLNEEYDRISDYISNKTYNTIATLLIDGRIVVASEDYLLFCFDDESYINVFDVNYKQIELFLNEIYKHIYKVVAVSIKEWDLIRKEFINNKKNNVQYVFIEENDVKLDMNEEFGELENSALNIFGEDTISVK